MPKQTIAPQEITQQLERWREGDQKALKQVISEVYSDMIRIATALLRRGNNTLFCPTALVNEAYLKVSDYCARRPWQDRTQFFGLITTVMQRLLIDRARKRKTDKHGGKAHKINLDPSELPQKPSIDRLVLNELLWNLEHLDHRRALIWECRYLCGLSIKELTVIFTLSSSTLHKEIKAANGWLRYQLLRT